MSPTDKTEYVLNKSEVDKQYTCSRGSGGQNVNRRSTCVILSHKPTGLSVRVEDTRYQFKNEEIAWKRLTDKLSEIYNQNKYEKQKSERFNQIGFSERSDKRRTYRISDDVVIDHITGKQMRFKDFVKGKIELLK